MAVTLDNLKAELPSYAYETISDGLDSVGERALEKGRNWIKAKIAGCSGALYNEEDEFVKEILLKRALYELYEYNDQETIANDKKNDAYELLRAKFGACVDPTNQPASGGSSSRVPPGASIVNRDRNKESF